MSKLLEITSLSKNFGGLSALSKVNLDIEPGMIAGLIGPNGAGKTTLFNCLTGIYGADQGEVIFRGRNIKGLPSHQITALGMARTFQNIRLFNRMTVLDNVLVSLDSRLKTGIWGAVFHSRRNTREERSSHARGMQLLRSMGLQDRAHEPALNLAYGDQRRLEIARALALEPELLLLDEPSAGMNPHETSELISFIKKIRLEKNLTILLIEHDMRVVMNVSDRVTVLDYGIRIAEGSPAEIQKNPEVIKAYLGQGMPGLKARP